MPFVLAFILLLQLTSATLRAEEQALPNPISEEHLRELVESASTDAKINDALQACHLFPEAVKITAYTENKDQDRSEIKVQVQTKAASNGYLVMTRSDEKGALLFSDLIRYHETTRLYHRWRIFADHKTPTQIFLGDPHAPRTPQEGAVQMLNLFWRSIHPGDPITIVENFASHEGGRGLSSHLLELSNHRVLRRESLVKFQPTPIPEEPSKVNSFFSKLFGNQEDDPTGILVDNKVSTFEPLNFQFTHPGNGYLPLDPKKLNPDASIFLINRKKNAGFTIIVEALGEGFLNQEQLEDLAIQNFRMVLTNAGETRPEKVSIDGVTFTVVSVVGMRGPTRHRYVSFLASHNGYVCQLISNSLTLDEKLQSTTPSVWEDFYFEFDQSGERRSPFKIELPVELSSKVSLILPDHLTLAAPTWQSSVSKGPGYSHQLEVLDDGSIHNTLRIQPGLFEKELFPGYSKGLSKSLQSLQGDLQLLPTS
ncbi:hypothetical protein V2O64_21035 [Verrucomicrobiaceae bacterium 227]